MRRIALLSVHTCPRAQPGSGWAGGMNVYVDELARGLVRHGVAVDIYTRRHSAEVPDTVVVEEGLTIHHIAAGPEHEIAPEHALRYLGIFSDRVIDRLRRQPDTSLIHSHYWLSGWTSLRIAAALDLPQVQSFHTLGRVRNRERRPGVPPAGLSRLVTEEQVISGADRIIASTVTEQDDLIGSYGADPAKICIAPPGIDHDLFSPGPRMPARIRLGWPQVPTILFVGRIQSAKGPDIAVESFAALRDRVPDARLVLVGAPAGNDGAVEFDALERLVKKEDLIDVVTFAEPVPHQAMADVYRAADVVVMPSRSESFGLVAAEAQASGVPVVAAAIGGLPHVVPPGSGGLLVDGWEPEVWAEAVGRVLEDRTLATTLAAAGPDHATTFSWDAAVERILSVYRSVG